MDFWLDQEHGERWSWITRGGGYRGNRRNNKKHGYRGSYFPRFCSGCSYRSRGQEIPYPSSRPIGEGDALMGKCDDAAMRGRKRYDNASGSGLKDGNDLAKRARFGLPVNSRDESGDSEWYKVLIPRGINVGKDFILTGIMRLIDVPFVPTNYHFEEQNVIFHVNDKAAASAIRGVSKKITMPTGHKMNIIVKPSHSPNIPMSDEMIEKLKVCMRNRYDPTSKSLNLSSLFTDKDLTGAQYHLSLASRQVMTNAIKFIVENIPELCVLDLSSNKLLHVDDLAPLVPATVDMKCLKLSKNKLKETECLRKLSAWKLDMLSLDDNPLRDEFSDQSSYIRAVRSVFPKVLKLDDIDLPATITLGTEARTDLPKAKDNCFPNPEVQGCVVKFLKDYFMMYDSDNRSGLLGAYHNEAMFSLTVAYNGAVSYKQPSLAAYIVDSRNLIKMIKDGGRRQKFKFKYGTQIIPQLCLLPKTVHEPNKFTVDCSFATTNTMNVTVQGVFEEVDKNNANPLIRAFSRTFITGHGGSGMRIINDMLTITNPSQDQVVLKSQFESSVADQGILVSSESEMEEYIVDSPATILASQPAVPVAATDQTATFHVPTKSTDRKEKSTKKTAPRRTHGTDDDEEAVAITNQLQRQQVEVDKIPGQIPQFLKKDEASAMAQFGSFLGKLGSQIDERFVDGFYREALDLTLRTIAKSRSLSDDSM